jgi:valyl-tRNA synthetase
VDCINLHLQTIWKSIEIPFNPFKLSFRGVKMVLPKKYKPQNIEIQLQSNWKDIGTYHFNPDADTPIYSIDTPPPTVSGHLHLGHVFSYSHPDFIARFWRMNGHNVFYPMGYDDNGIPTERLVEQRLGVQAMELNRDEFIKQCRTVSIEAEKEYQNLWQRLGISIDWRYTYRTIDEMSQRISQRSFLDLHEKDFVYQKEAPTLWCPECRTAIAQAELDEMQRNSEFITLEFQLISPPSETSTKKEEAFLIATTRPELLPACVAVFVHPRDERYIDLVGKKVRVPLYNRVVPIMADSEADPDIGTGAVMCCTFGDATDVSWWYKYNLPLIETIDQNGCLTTNAGDFAGIDINSAREKVKYSLEEKGFLKDCRITTQSIRVHERCDTPVEYIVTKQWFVRILDFKEKLKTLGEEIAWYPPHMLNRYQAWVDNLKWDWCISRQRFYGVPFPIWYCDECKEPIFADEDQLPVDPRNELPNKGCNSCGNNSFTPETDIMDTWATSSLSPQIVGQWLSNPALYKRVFPMSLRPQAHEIIRTWAFYTIVKSHYHFNKIPWNNALISGWGIAGDGMGKISKSRGGGALPPLEMIETYSADAVRYWSASTGLGKDAIISENKIRLGNKLITKMWNVARFSTQFLEGYRAPSKLPQFSSADAWILSYTQTLIGKVTSLFSKFQYASAKNEIEIFFWNFANNYLEMIKQRLYGKNEPLREGALFALFYTQLALIKLFAPILPHITEEIYLQVYKMRDIFQQNNDEGSTTEYKQSIHISSWPKPDEALKDEFSESFGDILVDIATTVRRYKSENGVSLSSEIKRLQLATQDQKIYTALIAAKADISSITRATKIDIADSLDPALSQISSDSPIRIAINP